MLSHHLHSLAATNTILQFQGGTRRDIIENWAKFCTLTDDCRFGWWYDAGAGIEADLEREGLILAAADTLSVAPGFSFSASDFWIVCEVKQIVELWW